MRVVREIVLSPTKSRWGVSKNGQFDQRTNFAWRLKYSVATSLPSGPGYVVDVIRSADRKQGTAFFLCSHPQKDVHHFVQAIQTSFKVANHPEDGGFFSTLTKNELLRLITEMDKELREKDEEVYKKTLVQLVGSQPNSNVTLLNPSQMFSGAGIEIRPEDSRYIWIETWPGSPPAHLYREIETPFSLAAIGEWLALAKRIQGDNFPATLMALGATMGMCAYRHLLNTVGHFNLPLMFGPPMSGKTLTAQCLAKITGADSVYSRCTLAALTELCSMSTIPIVWDDPTGPSDVCQLAIDLGNGATRGTRDRVIVPQTGCLVTANFNLGEAMKYYSRLNLTVFKKVAILDVGHASQLEEAARNASAALPAMICLAQSTTAEEIRHHTQQIISVSKKLEVRLVEGMSVAMTVVIKILDALNLPWGDELFTYIQREVISSHLQRLGHCDVPIPTSCPVERMVRDLLKELSIEQIEELIRLEDGSVAIRVAELPLLLKQRVGEVTGGVYKNVRLGLLKKTKKCRVFQLPGTESVRALLERRHEQVGVTEAVEPTEDVEDVEHTDEEEREEPVEEPKTPIPAPRNQPKQVERPVPQPRAEKLPGPCLDGTVACNPVFTLVVKQTVSKEERKAPQAAGVNRRPVRQRRKTERDDFFY